MNQIDQLTHGRKTISANSVAGEPKGTRMNSDLDLIDQQFNKRIVSIVLVAALLLLATIIGGYMFLPWFETRGFQAIEGTIAKSEMKSCGEPGMYHEAIRFSYTVDGHKYLNGRLRKDFALMCEGEKKIQEILDQYPVGAKVNAWYNPNVPSVAIIDRSLGTMQKIFLAVFSAFVGFFLLIWWGARNKSKKLAKRRRK